MVCLQTSEIFFRIDHPYSWLGSLGTYANTSVRFKGQSRTHNKSHCRVGLLLGCCSRCTQVLDWYTVLRMLGNELWKEVGKAEPLGKSAPGLTNCLERGNVNTAE